MERKFKDGDTVYERIRPNQKLVVTTYIGNLYYCQTQEIKRGKTLAYFERELKGEVT